MTFFVNFFVAAVLMGTTLMYGTLGEILTEKAGNMNLGVEGLIYMGGSSGLIAAFLYERAAGDGAVPMVAVLLAFAAAFLAAALGSLLYSFLTITLRTNRNVTGLALTLSLIHISYLWRCAGVRSCRCWARTAAARPP